MKVVKLTLISIIHLFMRPAYAEFKKENLRLGTARDFIKTLEAHFPIAAYDPVIKPQIKVKSQCRNLVKSNRYILGGINAAISTAPISQPGISFIRWWSDCLNDYTRVSWQLLRKNYPTESKQWRLYYPEDIFEFQKEKSIPKQLETIKWKDLTAKQKTGWINYLLNHLIGPGSVIKELNLGTSKNQIIGNILKSTETYTDDNTFEIGKKLVTYVLLREEAISY